jgi:hypothetical protein
MFRVLAGVLLCATVAAARPVGCGTPTSPSGQSEVTANPSSLTFTLGAGQSQSANLVINEVNVSTDRWTATATAAWLSVSPDNGNISGLLGTTGSATTTVTANASGLAAGTYSASVQITPSRVCSGTPTVGIARTVPVTLTVVVPALSVSPTTLTFTATQGGPNPPGQTVTITNTGSGTLNWSGAIPTGGAWLRAVPGNGSGNAVVTVSVVVGSLTAGTYNGQLRIDAPGATNSPQTINVELRVSAAASSLAIAVSPAAVSLTPGGASQTVAVTLTRTAFTGEVTLAATGLPSGVTATYTQPGTGSSGAVILAAATGAPPVSGVNATITASGTGVSPATTTVAVSVQGTCSYGLSPGSLSSVATGGTAAITITTACAWTAVSQDSWIVITSASSGTGNGTLNIAYAENAGTAARTGQIIVSPPAFQLLVSPRFFTLTQAGRPASVPPTSFQPTLQRRLAPGFYILEATLSSAATLGGFWGLEVITSLGRADGGFNLGGAMHPAAAQLPGFGAFNLDSRQTVTATLNAQTAPGTMLTMRFLDRDKRLIGQPVAGLPPLTLQQTLDPGFYVIEVYNAGGVPFTYQLGVAAPFFVGGVVTGGFVGPGITGFGAFYVAEEQDVTMRFYGRTAYGAAGSGDLTMTLKDAQRRVIATVAP